MNRPVKLNYTLASGPYGQREIFQCDMKEPDEADEIDPDNEYLRLILLRNANEANARLALENAARYSYAMGEIAAKHEVRRVILDLRERRDL